MHWWRGDPGESYRRDQVEPDARFDDVETTISHLFRAPHPALGGRSYGHALHDALVARGVELGRGVVELGGGTGAVAVSVRAAAAPRGGRAPPWTFVELSRRLLEAQRARVPDAIALAAHAERLPLRAGAVAGLLLANEVIADLRVEEAGCAEAAALVERYALPVAGSRSLVNVGAIRLVERVARCLAPGGAACLTEFGGDFEVGGVELEGRAGAGRHVEHSIRFDHLERVARAHGLDVERTLLAELLEIDRAARVASYADVVRLRFFAPDLPVLAHPKELLEARHPRLLRFFSFELPRIDSPRFPSPTSRGGFCQLFVALLLRRA